MSFITSCVVTFQCHYQGKNVNVNYLQTISIFKGGTFQLKAWVDVMNQLAQYKCQYDSMTFHFFCCCCCLYILNDRHLTLDLWAFNTFFSLTNSTTSMTETPNWCVLVLARLQLIHSEVIWLLGRIKTNDLTFELAQMFTFFFFLIQLSFLTLWLSPRSYINRQIYEKQCYLE